MAVKLHFSEMIFNCVFPTSYLPSISYYSHYVTELHPVVDSNEFMVKQSYRNRCLILGANGVQQLIVPVKKRNSKILVKNVEICNAENWQKNHWKTIESAYRKSPFFEFYADDLSGIYMSTRYENLLQFNTELILRINKILKTEVNMVFSDKYIESTQVKNDFRSFHFNKKSAAEYIQVFSSKYGFQPNLSIIDLIFNEGPNSLKYLKTFV